MLYSLLQSSRAARGTYAADRRPDPRAAVSLRDRTRNRRPRRSLRRPSDARIGWLRVAFGAIWGLDAYLKWQPAFLNNFLAQVAAGATNQPHWLAPWFTFWRHIVQVAPNLMGYLVAATETTLAVALVSGVLPRLVLTAGLAYSLAIWSIPEGFGGIGVPGATDPGAGIIYAVVFAALLLLHSRSAAPVPAVMNTQLRAADDRVAA
jgi:thiosulfate dehydrogenase [quinone] large subunit